MEELIELIVDSLSDNLLESKYKTIKNKNIFTGHCYIATEVLYYLINDDEKINYIPARIKINNDNHWVLVNKITNEIYDVTKNQFSFPIDYSKIRKCWFLTKTPSKRTLILLNRIHEKNYY
jgi:hypothetical protein